jgi:hypothetical protein
VEGVTRCPRCGTPASEPDVWSAQWTCALHGPVEPLHPFGLPTAALTLYVAEHARVPVWIPWPLPVGWLVTGVGHAGDLERGASATVVACSGPNPVGGGGDLLLIAEEPTVGLGSSYAGLAGTDPGETFDGTAAHAKVSVGGRPSPMWCLTGPIDRAVYVGEAGGCWLWMVLHPASAGVLLAERLRLADVRDLGAEIDMVPFGALSPRVHLAPPTD